MKKVLSLLLFLFTVNQFIKAQLTNEYFDNNALFTFQKRPWINNNDFLISNLKNFQGIDTGKVYYRIPLNFHVFKTITLPSYNNYRSFKNIIDRLNNKYYKNTGISFYIQNINFYNDTKFLKTQYVTELPFLVTIDKDPYALDIYYVNLIEYNHFFRKTYNRGVYIYTFESIALTRNAAASTLPHEIGHFLGLKHPHRNWRGGKLFQESVSRTRKSGIFRNRVNCEVRGDFLSDTPAQPDLRAYTNYECRYTTNLKDAWGDSYTPQTDNIMSYVYNPDCRDMFTKMQISVMLYTISHNRNSSLYEVNNQNKIFTFDTYEPDDNIWQANKLKINQLQQHTFHAVPLVNKKGFLPNDYDFYLIQKIDSIAYLKIEASENLKIQLNIFDVNFVNQLTDTIVETKNILIDSTFTDKNIMLKCISNYTKDTLYEYTIEILNQNEK